MRPMRHALAALLLATLCARAPLAQAQAPAALPPLAALLSHEIEEQGSDGILRISRYRERYYRADGQTWVERELPAWAQNATHHAGAGHDHEHELDLRRATRWVRVAADGRATLQLVDAPAALRYSVAPEEYARTGFSGHWRAETSLIDPATLARLQPLTRKAPAGARWYARESGGEYERVLWDARRVFPLALETGSADGRRRARTTVQWQPLPAQWPWLAAARYGARELGDLGD